MGFFGTAALLLLGTAAHSGLAQSSATTDPSTASSLSVAELWKLQTTLWDNFLYPANAKQMQSINSTLFAPNVCNLKTKSAFKILCLPHESPLFNKGHRSKVVSISLAHLTALSSTRNTFLASSQTHPNSR
jgi:hypothetical protein